MRRLKVLATGALIALASASLLAGCPGLPCDCGDPDVRMLPTDLTTVISDIRIADWLDGGDSDEWAWHDQGSPWGEVVKGEVVEGEVSIAGDLRHRSE